MKKINFTLLIAGLLFFISCENKENAKAEIKYIATTLGGCNEGAGLRSYESGNDTVIISKGKEAIQVYVAHNYICGVPFKTECEIKMTVFYGYNKYSNNEKAGFYCYTSVCFIFFLFRK